MNANYAIAVSAAMYCFRCLIDADVPYNAGLLRPIRVIAPERSVVNAGLPAAMAAGNVETSQRITDVILGALAKALPERIPAASSGTMNNLSFGGWDTLRNRPFAYYETIAGGMGASARGAGTGGDAHAHDQQLEHADRSIRARISGARAGVPDSRRIGRGREARGWRWDRARVGVSGYRRCDDSFRPSQARALGIAGRREWGLRQVQRGWEGASFEDPLHDSTGRDAACRNAGRRRLGPEVGSLSAGGRGSIAVSIRADRAGWH